ncbi:MAG TPA: hypothetical protein VEI04_00405 [Syntrophobacteria bacterium]|nr:hypothetical protein [Syntrophobacteria bacterium]
MGYEQPVTLVRDDCLSLFCSIGCRDGWLSIHPFQEGMEPTMEAFKSKAFAYGPDPAVK